MLDLAGAGRIWLAGLPAARWMASAWWWRRHGAGDVRASGSADQLQVVPAGGWLRGGVEAICSGRLPARLLPSSTTRRPWASFFLPEGLSWSSLALSTAGVRLRVKAYGPVAGSGDGVVSASLPPLGRRLEDLFPSALCLGWTCTASRLAGAQPEMRVVGVAICVATTMVGCGARSRLVLLMSKVWCAIGCAYVCSRCDREVGAARGGDLAATMTP